MPNKWVKKSLEVANSKGYLDRLSEIYPATLLPVRPLEEFERSKIEELYKNGRFYDLLIFLLKLTKKKHPFPIEHPYASLLRQKPKLIELNPGIVKTLCNILESMRLEDIIKGCERPADINRIMGSAFRKWIKEYFTQHGYQFIQENIFEVSNHKVFLDRTNSGIYDYMREKLGIDISRGRDFLAKMNGKLVIGEARFLTTSGGSQTRDLEETLSFVKEVKGKIIAVAVIDGIVWFNRSYLQKLERLSDDEPALSALLLKDFLEEIS